MMSISGKLREIQRKLEKELSGNKKILLVAKLDNGKFEYQDRKKNIHKFNSISDIRKRYKLNSGDIIFVILKNILGEWKK